MEYHIIFLLTYSLTGTSYDMTNEILIHLIPFSQWVYLYKIGCKTMCVYDQEDNSETIRIIRYITNILLRVRLFWSVVMLESLKCNIGIGYVGCREPICRY